MGFPIPRGGRAKRLADRPVVRASDIQAARAAGALPKEWTLDHVRAFMAEQVSHGV